MAFRHRPRSRDSVFKTPCGSPRTGRSRPPKQNKIAQLMDRGRRVDSGLVYGAFEPRLRTDFSRLGHSYAGRALSLPLADRLQQRTTLLKELFLIIYYRSFRLDASGRKYRSRPLRITRDWSGQRTLTRLKGQFFALTHWRYWLIS